jgi:hypothetical protein
MALEGVFVPCGQAEAVKYTFFKTYAQMVRSRTQRAFGD